MDDLWDDDEPVLSPPPRRSRRWRRLLLLVLAAVAVWQLPRVTLMPAVRDWPLQQAFAGIAGRLSSGGADWNWFGPISYRDVLLETSDGQPLLAIDRLTIGRSPLWLALRPTDLGQIAVHGGRLSTAVWQGGSTIETVLAPWLARLAETPAPPPAAPAAGQWGGGVAGGQPAAPPAAVSGSLELLDVTVELIDLRHRDAWWITDLAVTVPLSAAAAGGLPPIDTVLSGRLRHVGQPQLVVPGTSSSPAAAGAASVASRTAATLARDGGWSLTVTAADPAGSRSLAVGGTRLPAGCSRLAASRFGWPLLIAGQLDVRADVTVAPAPAGVGRSTNWQLAASGSLAGRQLSVRDAATGRERLLIDRLELPFGLAASPGQLRLRRLELESSLGRADVTGTIRLPAALPAAQLASAWSWLEAIAGPECAAHIELDLAAVARSLAGGIALRPDVRVTGGAISLDLAGDGQGIELRTTLEALQAIQGTDDLRWPEPCAAWLRARRLASGRLQLTEARLAAAAAEIAATNRPTGIETTWRLDLGDLFAAFAELFDLRSADGSLTVSGTARGRMLVGQAPDAAATTLSAAASLEDFTWSAAGRPVWQDDLVAIDLDAIGTAAAGQVALDQASLRIETDGDLAAAALAGECMLTLPTATGGWPQLQARQGGGGTIDCRLAGGLDRWQARLLGLAAAVGWSPPPAAIELAGRLDSSLTISSAGSQWQVTKATGQIDSLVVAADSLRIAEPRVMLSAAGSIDPERGLIDLASAEVLTATASLRTNGMRVAMHSVVGDELLDLVRGRLQWQADLARLQRWLSPTLPRYAASGRVWGTAELADAENATSLLVELTGSQLALTASPPRGEPLPAGREVWNEPQLQASLDLTRPAPAPAGADQLVIDRLVVESSTLGLAASGKLSDLRGSRQLDLRGTFATNFSQLTRLLTPASGGMVQLAGGGPRPFALSGSLNPVGGAAAEAGSRPVELPLPEQWQGRVAGRAGRLIALPRGTAAQRPTSFADRLAGLTAETTLAWQGGRLAEFPMGPGELPVRLVEGQLAFGPFDIPVSGGRVRGAPWLQLAPPPGELVLPPGPVVEHVVLTPAICSHYLGWLSPILRSATEASGRLSVETGGGRLPLADLLAGRLDGQLWLEDFAVTPGDMAGPLVNLLAQLQSVVDPRFAFGDRAVLLRARPEPIRVQLAAGRVHHDNLVLDMGQLSVRSKGSVGRDGSLAMQLEVAFRGELAGATPVVAGLLRTPFVIPLRGTVRRPQFDATAIDTILGRIMENTADAVLRDGIGRGLEALFGNPQAPVSPNQPQRSHR